MRTDLGAGLGDFRCKQRVLWFEEGEEHNGKGDRWRKYLGFTPLGFTSNTLPKERREFESSKFYFTKVVPQRSITILM